MDVMMSTADCPLCMYMDGRRYLFGCGYECCENCLSFLVPEPPCLMCHTIAPSDKIPLKPSKSVQMEVCVKLIEFGANPNLADVVSTEIQGIEIPLLPVGFSQSLL